MQKEYLCFIDYAYAFDKECHKELFEMLGKLDLFAKYNQNYPEIIQIHYWRRQS